MIDFKNKRFLVLGVANEKSIAWGISQVLHQAGAELAFTYVNESIEKRVRPLAESIESDLILPCDVKEDIQIDHLFEQLAMKWSNIDGIVHSLAYAEKEDLQNRFHQTTRAGFHTALEISAFSLIKIADKSLPLMKTSGGSILTLTYLGSQKVISNYKVMGVAKAALECSVKYLAADLGEFNIRVNALSAGPIKTLAASGIPRFREMLNSFASAAPLKRNVTTEDIGNAAAFYLSSASAGITGEITYVDCGFNNIGISSE